MIKIPNIEGRISVNIMKQLGKSKILTVQTKRKMWVGFALPTSDMQQGNGVIGYRGLFVSK